ncbi:MULTISPECIES: Flp family type IVb pilin [unclassified Sphingomonas]|uniref:Flp family type IVb pilin n=1 Tax=unclassified Sphingomonas TaxID=196159 RepID=UPI0022B53877|nr:Flp family type IVb pilin [Sphingomonas sp. NIBR02145]WHU03152.1 Flp family type IVb pilin [Sphingomonas sp. NIBR02145]
MRALVRAIRLVIDDRRAATAVEYGFILALIVLAMMASLTSVANQTKNMWGNVTNKVQTATQS